MECVSDVFVLEKPELEDSVSRVYVVLHRSGRKTVLNSRGIILTGMFRSFPICLLKVYESIDYLCASSLLSLFIFNLRTVIAAPLLRDIFIRKILNGFIFSGGTFFSSFKYCVSSIAKDGLWKYNAVYRFFIVKGLLKTLFIVFSCLPFISKQYRFNTIFFIYSLRARIIRFSFYYSFVLFVIFSYLYHGIIFKIDNKCLLIF